MDPRREPRLTLATALIVSLLSVVALFAEAALFFLGLAGKVLTDPAGTNGVSRFWFLMVVVTIAVGLLTPICAGIEQYSKRRGLGTQLLFPALLLILLYSGYLAYLAH